MRELLKFSINKYVIFVILMLLSAYPYIFDTILGIPEEKIMNIVFFALSIVVFMSTSGKWMKYDIVNLSFVVQCVAWLFFSIYHRDSSYYTRIFFLVFTYIVLQILFRRQSVVKFGFAYNNIVTLQAVLGAVAFILVFVGVLPPLYEFARGGRIISFYGLTCTNITVGNFIRVAGFFDEPGALASWGIFALIINKIIYDNRKIELFLIISLFFTFSAAYFILLPLYLLFFYRFNTKKIIISLIVLIPLIFLGIKVLNDNEYFRWITIERFEGGEVRSKRMDYADEALIVFKKNISMGQGGRKLEEQFEGVNDNPYEILAKDGIIGYIITYLPLLLLCIKFRKNRNVLFGSLILFICYQQRPFHINEMHHFMLYFYMMIIFCKFGKPSIETHYLEKYIKKNE